MNDVDSTDNKFSLFTHIVTSNTMMGCFLIMTEATPLSYLHSNISTNVHTIPQIIQLKNKT